ncbi:MAG: hypothetical protein L0H93_17295 [Nocardioides sp.]|nr:hypothetical protein [Nocardioides sp.]
MININTPSATVTQPWIAMPTYAFGEVACAHVDVTTRERAIDAPSTGVTPGIPVWSPPPR